MSAGRLAIWPSIDLRGGRVVRLLRGEWDAVTTFDADPVETARTFEREGADGLHVVDLDAAFGTRGEQKRDSSSKRSDCVPMQVGGGMRTARGRRRFLRRGECRTRGGRVTAVPRPPRLHSPSKKTPLFLSFFLVLFFESRRPHRRRPRLQGGAADRTRVDGGRGGGDAAAVAREMWGLGVKALLVTDVGRDGAMEGPNLALLAAVRRGVRAARSSRPAGCAGRRTSRPWTRRSRAAHGERSSGARSTRARRRSPP